MRFVDRTVIVTGGASGIGRATAQLFAAEGARVVVVDVQRAQGEATVAEILRASGSAYFVCCDVSQEHDVAQMVARAVEVFGGIDILFLNAGIGLAKDVAHTTLEEWDRVLGVNVRGVYLCSRYALPYLKQRGEGSIVIDASANGVLAEAELGAYCASKGALIALTRSMALDYARDNIRVNCVCPGYIDTPINAGYFASPGAREKAARLHPIGRIGQPQDVANAVLFLASSEASFITGAALAVDGGLTAAIVGS
ncbi:MAG TPA: SDR family NAD(P)-dependent oxidoreductase [Aggregatilineaceae bacterium]|nr:SDR family NAD(P)-dependent oxidoreductase [Aggregatilineaceae bacterium]